ncbi:M24 family metallopeptidase [Alloiococcus sp. CFN-8]|uniref:M24 family metallopeptidase n=1 Tax=Alloiococcus sp. CFN-8 TaxID=3416081 RepID=UPI003CECE511
MKTNRVNRILKLMEKEGVNQLIITSPASIYYLTERYLDPGERLVALYLNNQGEATLVINELFPFKEVEGLKLLWYKDSEEPVDRLLSLVNKNYPLGIDKEWPSRFLIKLMERGAAKGYVNSSPIIDRARMIKDEEEQKLMREASRINDRVMERLITSIKGDISEKGMTNILRDIYEEEGADGFSFSPIIAYGANGADPHHHCDGSLLKRGDSIILDIGGIKSNYCSDMTRTVFYQEVSEKHRTIYEIVREANLAAIGQVKPGARFCDIDRAAREVIEKAGYGKYFTHRTGHSIGLEVHDFGDVSSVNTERVAPGMIFSIEPGIYLPQDFGVRIEDLVLVTEEGAEVLNSTSKDLRIIEG